MGKGVRSPALVSGPHAAGVAQSAERLHGKEEVRGSIPLSGSLQHRCSVPMTAWCRSHSSRHSLPAKADHDRGTTSYVAPAERLWLDTLHPCQTCWSSVGASWARRVRTSLLAVA